MEPIVLVILLKLAPWLIVGIGAVVLARSAVGQALARRLRDKSATATDVAALASDLQEVRRELAEVQERLDFTERLLTRHRGAPPPHGSSEHDSPTPPELAPAGRT